MHPENGNVPDSVLSEKSKAPTFLILKAHPESKLFFCIAMFGLSEISWGEFTLAVLLLCVVFNLAVWAYYALVAKGRTTRQEQLRLRKFAEGEHKENEEK